MFIGERANCRLDGCVKLCLCSCASTTTLFFNMSRLHAFLPVPVLPRPLVPPTRRVCSPRMSWKPSGLLSEPVAFLKHELSILEETLEERPDHPVNLRRSFFADKTSHHLSKSLRRRDATLAVIVALKRFQPIGTDKPQLVAEVEDLSYEARRLNGMGVDAAFVYADPTRYGVDRTEIMRITKSLRISSRDRGMPVVRSDLIIDPIQVAEAAYWGASAVNVVAAAAMESLEDILNAATMMGMEAVVECHDEIEVDWAIECGATIIYLSNWDRKRNVLVEGRAKTLVRQVPPWVMKIGGGGISTSRDCWELMDEGFHAVMIGEALLKSRRIEGFIKEIRSQKRVTGDVFAGGIGIPYGDEGGHGDQVDHVH